MPGFAELKDFFHVSLILAEMEPLTSSAACGLSSTRRLVCTYSWRPWESESVSRGTQGLESEARK